MQHPDQSRLADNILHFCRTLRHAGLPIGPGAVVDALAAVAGTGIRRRDDFFYALRAVLVKEPAEFRLFDQAFHIYFRNPRLLERMMSMLLPVLQQDNADIPSEKAIRRLIESLARDPSPGMEEVAIEVDRSESYSASEILRSKDFEQMSTAELLDAQRMLRESANPARTVMTRRLRASTSGSRYDLRRSMRLMLQSDGQLIRLARKRQYERPQTLVLLCDISGSMSRYSRMFLHYAHALAGQDRSVHTFLFGTRLTNISRWLRVGDADHALLRISAEVPDWDGGTRIADCLQSFNVKWSRRVLAGNATVVLLCDGLERDSHAELEFQMQRLKRSCRELIWMNPMLRYDAFEPKASGIRAMLPHVDRFVAAHNIASVVELGRMLADRSALQYTGRAA